MDFLAADGPPIAALAPVIVLLVAFVGYSLVDIVRVDEAEARRRGASIPLGRMGVPADLVAAYAYLASAEAEYVTGAILPVDGGVLAQQRSPDVDIFGLDRFPRIEKESGWA